VVGAGMAGVSVACELARDRRVVLLEAESQPGYHATGRSAAFYVQAYGNEVIQALTTASRAFFEQPPASFTDQALLTPRGSLFIGGADQRAALESQYEAAADLVPGLALEDGAFAERLVPILRRGKIAACVWEPDARRIDVHALLQGYLRRFRAAGGEFLAGARVRALDRSGDSWSCETNRGVFTAGTLVNAAGAWADELAQLAGAEAVGLQPMRRTACIIDVPAGIDSETWPAVADVAETFYFIPEAGGLLLSPADETPSPPADAHPEDLDVAVAVDRFEAATTISVKRVRQSWAGLRTFAPDRSPVAGFDPRVDGFFWLAGQGGYGIQTAPALARYAAALIRGENVPSDLARLGVSEAALSPARFAQDL